MTRRLIFILLSILLAGCSAAPTPTPAPPTPEPTLTPTPFYNGPMAISAKARITDPKISSSDLKTLVNGNNKFAFSLFQQVSTQDGNLIFSPYSISLALAMTFAGARGATESAMAQTLHFNLPQERLHPAFNALGLDLDQRSTMGMITLDDEEPNEDSGGFVLRIANSLWGQKDFNFLPEFLDTLAENYGAGMQLVDFITDPEAARQVINQWVSEQTSAKINDLIPAGSISTDSRLILTNAIYFKGSWDNWFSDAQPEPFYLVDGTQVEAQMMHVEEWFYLFERKNYFIVDIPYLSPVSMILIVPDSGKFETVEQALTLDQLNNDLKEMNSIHQTYMILGFPKFSCKTRLGLGDTLSSMGMNTALDNDADFSGISNSAPLKIADISHVSFIAVDEQGTEAAAATSVRMVEIEAAPEPPSPIPVTIDRPFIFLIRDKQTGTILFIGRVLDPTAN